MCSHLCIVLIYCEIQNEQIISCFDLIWLVSADIVGQINEVDKSNGNRNDRTKGSITFFEIKWASLVKSWMRFSIIVVHIFVHELSGVVQFVQLVQLPREVEICYQNRKKSKWLYWGPLICNAHTLFTYFNEYLNPHLCASESRKFVSEKRRSKSFHTSVAVIWICVYVDVHLVARMCCYCSQRCLTHSICMQ